MNYNIIDKCNGCGHITGQNKDICAIWMSPNAKWSMGQCPNDTKYQKKAIEEKALNPIKASKKKSRRK